jgi:hypothetical protein
MSVRRTLLVLAGASALSVTTLLPAQAQTLAVGDARGDVTAFDDTMEQPEAVDPTVRNGDVVRTVFRHTGRRISVRAKFADLAKQGDVRQDFLQLRTDEGQQRFVMVLAGRGGWAGETMMFRGNGSDVSCRIRHHIDYADDVLTLSFPRRCAGSPRWVRVGFASMSGTEEQMYVDDAQSRGPVGNELTMSPRLRRG